MKGTILAGGSGTRLAPLTNIVCKQLLPVYDKPMIYYPLSILMKAGIKDILIISTKRDIVKFKELFSNGEKLGINLQYEVQKRPNVIAEAFIIGKEFIKDESVTLILGDNIFYGKQFEESLKENIDLQSGGKIFGCKVKHPESYGVIEFDENKKVLSIEEKPVNPKSDYIIPGIYIYDNSVIKKAENLKPSKRNELEITDISNMYLKENNLSVEILSEENTWYDTGTCNSLLEAENFIQKEQKETGKYIGCIEEIAYKNSWITKEQLLKSAKTLLKTEYGKYLLKIVNE